MIGDKFNMDDSFYRDLTVCFLDKIEGQVKWINKFTSGDVNVSVPFYYSLTGDERFLLESFQDDIVSNNRFVELNTDIIPRGHVTLTSFTINSDQFRNPNVWVRDVFEDTEKKEVRSQLKKLRAIPITATYDISIILKTEIDVFKCSQAIMNTLWLYKFMYFEHNYMHIDAVLHIPDNFSIEIDRNKTMSNDNNIKMSLSVEVKTYYPAFPPDERSINPHRTKWFNNIIATRTGNARQSNNNTDNPPGADQN